MVDTREGERMKLITGEHCENVDQALINEYNNLTYQLNREIFLFTQEEVLSKYGRIKELITLLGIGENEQLVLF
jgi:hypothetical protein